MGDSGCFWVSPGVVLGSSGLALGWFWVVLGGSMWFEVVLGVLGGSVWFWVILLKWVLGGSGVMLGWFWGGSGCWGVLGGSGLGALGGSGSVLGGSGWFWGASKRFWAFL